tara:strand:- start:3142 stop:3450 length:309 start_codon:yes stop_codon:yes gene_type:complete
MTHDEMIEVIKAHKDGKVIQFRPRIVRGEWMTMTKGVAPIWNFDMTEYRVKPEPKEYWLVPYVAMLGFMVFEYHPAILPPEFNGAGLDFPNVIHVVTVVKDE